MLYDKVKKMCDNKGITIAQLERELDFSNGSLAKNGSAMKTDRLVKIAAYFGVSTDYLLEVEEMQKNNSLIADAVIKCVANPELAQLVSDVAALDPIHYEALRLYLSALHK